MSSLPNMGNIVPGDIFIGGNESHLFGNSGCDKQITVHLHIILKVIKRRVKIVRHTELSFSAAKSALFYLFRLCRSKGKHSPPRRYFTRHVNGQPMADRYFYSLCNAHGVSIA